MTMAGNMASAGMAGANTPVLALAVSLGSSMSLLGKAFTTKDMGAGAGAGVGTGLGLILPAAMISNEVYSQAMSAGLAGDKLKPLCDAIGAGLEAELKLAMLTSTHTPVAIGSGQVDPTTIAVIPSEWVNNVMMNGSAFAGQKWPDLAKAIGNGCSSAMSKASGVVTIVGVPAPPGPVPGTPGTGTGVIG